MLTEKMKQALIIAGFALLGVVAVAGWTRTPETVAASPNYFQTSNNGYAAMQPWNGENNRPVYGQAGVYGQAPVQSTAYPQGYGAANNCVEPMAVQSAAYAPAGEAYATPRYRTYSRPRVVRTYVREDGGNYVARRKSRSTAKSVAIVGGSAGVGAALGALAGGGKGAAIGALSGGTAGFIYDRLTHNR
jgi:hypothetical protein